mmetsp:Transcript_45156/g.112156  ORF Transcript_45156/g.112156 Transcript_45156/m.112156 type:complete len:283 (+) Transcript_45156:426-1274(+)
MSHLYADGLMSSSGHMRRISRSHQANGFVSLPPLDAPLAEAAADGPAASLLLCASPSSSPLVSSSTALSRSMSRRCAAVWMMPSARGRGSRSTTREVRADRSASKRHVDTNRSTLSICGWGVASSPPDTASVCVCGTILMNCRRYSSMGCGGHVLNRHCSTAHSRSSILPISSRVTATSGGTVSLVLSGGGCALRYSCARSVSSFSRWDRNSDLSARLTHAAANITRSCTSDENAWACRYRRMKMHAVVGVLPSSLPSRSRRMCSSVAHRSASIMCCTSASL